MTLEFLALLGAPYIYEISSLRVNVVVCERISVFRVDQGVQTSGQL